MLKFRVSVEMLNRVTLNAANIPTNETFGTDRWSEWIVYRGGLLCSNTLSLTVSKLTLLSVYLRVEFHPTDCLVAFVGPQPLFPLKKLMNTGGTPCGLADLGLLRDSRSRDENYVLERTAWDSRVYDVPGIHIYDRLGTTNDCSSWVRPESSSEPDSTSNPLGMSWRFRYDLDLRGYDHEKAEIWLRMIADDHMTVYVEGEHPDGTKFSVLGVPKQARAFHRRDEHADLPSREWWWLGLRGISGSV